MILSIIKPPINFLVILTYIQNEITLIFRIEIKIVKYIKK